jgi:hypothetical protein
MSEAGLTAELVDALAALTRVNNTVTRSLGTKDITQNASPVDAQLLDLIDGAVRITRKSFDQVDQDNAVEQLSLCETETETETETEEAAAVVDDTEDNVDDDKAKQQAPSLGILKKLKNITTYAQATTTVDRPVLPSMVRMNPRRPTMQDVDGKRLLGVVTRINTENYYMVITTDRTVEQTDRNRTLDALSIFCHFNNITVGEPRNYVVGMPVSLRLARNAQDRPSDKPIAVHGIDIKNPDDTLPLKLVERINGYAAYAFCGERFGRVLSDGIVTVDGTIYAYTPDHFLCETRDRYYVGSTVVFQTASFAGTEIAIQVRSGITCLPFSRVDKTETTFEAVSGCVVGFSQNVAFLVVESHGTVYTKIESPLDFMTFVTGTLIIQDGEDLPYMVNYEKCEQRALTFDDNNIRRIGSGSAHITLENGATSKVTVINQDKNQVDFHKKSKGIFQYKDIFIKYDDKETVGFCGSDGQEVPPRTLLEMYQSL